MSIGDKLHSAFSRMAKESTTNTSANNLDATSSPIADSLGKAGSAFQLNQMTEITSGFSKLFDQQPDTGLMDNILDKVDVEGLTDKIDIEGLTDKIDVESFTKTGKTSDSTSISSEADDSSSASSDEGASSGDSSSGDAGTCELSEEHQTAFDALTDGIAADFQTAVTAFDNATNTTGRRSATDDLWEWTRSHFPNKALMQGIAQSTELTETQKQYELGRFCILVLRMEYLVGYSRMRGVNQSSVPTWQRGSPDNLDDFYRDNMGGDNVHTAWCSRFAGYARKRTGFRTDLITNAGLLYNSGLRLYEWAVHDRTHDHKAWTTELGVSTATNEGVLVIPKEDFASLVTTLNSSSDKGSDVDSFFADSSRFEPQAGDLLIFGKDGNTWKSSFGSHTATIEKYNASTRCAYTIEGNWGKRVASRKIDFTNTALTDDLLYLIRPGSAQHKGNTDFDCVLTQTQINELYAGMKSHLETFAAVVTAKGYFHDTDNDALVYEWHNEP